MAVDKKVIDLIIRQTNYDETEAMNKLLEHDNDYLKVIKNYINPTNIKTYNHTDNRPKKTTNQLMYGEFRNLMDESCKNYRIKKDKEDKINQIIQNINMEKEKEKEREKENEKENENENEKENEINDIQNE